MSTPTPSKPRDRPSGSATRGSEGRTPRDGRHPRGDDARSTARTPRGPYRLDPARLGRGVAQPLQPVQGRRSVRCAGRARSGAYRRRAGPGEQPPAADHALGTDRVQNPDEDHAERIEAVVHHLYDDYPEEHAYHDLDIPRSGADEPVPWVLGSSPSSAAIAGEFGLRFCFAAFIRPQFATRAFEAYREQFRPSRLPGGIDEPEEMVAVNAVCAETDDEAAQLRAMAEASYRRMRRGVVGTRPSVEEAIDELGGVADHDDALRSHELLAEGVGLSSR